MIAPGTSVVVTGGAGFIGSHVCEALIMRGAVVRCLDDLSTGHRRNVEHLLAERNFALLEVDIRKPEQVREALRGANYVVHLAALGSVPRSILDPLASHATNFTGFLNTLEAARLERVGRLVYASSSSVYGDSKTLPKHEDDIGLPLSPYAVTKAGNEAYGQLYHRLYGFSSIGLRFFNVFGERQDPEGPYAAAIPSFIKSFLRHAPPKIHGDGMQTRDFTYVANAVDAVLASLVCPEAYAGRIYNVAYGERITLLQLVELLREELAKLDPAVVEIPVEHVAPRDGDVRDSLADMTRARKELGFDPKYDLKQGLMQAVPWYVRHWGSVSG